MNPLQQIADNLAALNSDAPEVADAVIKLTNMAAHPSRGVVDEAKALADFTEYFVRNYPGPDTIIGNPKWHAPRIFRAAMHALQAAALPAVPENTAFDPFEPTWPEGLGHGDQYELRCDDKGRNGGSWLRIFVANDGDVHVRMQEWEGMPEGEPFPIPGLRCRTWQGGGRHGRTHQALLWLAQAIRLDTLAATPAQDNHEGEE